MHTYNIQRISVLSTFIHPTTQTIGTGPSETTIYLILPWICWNPYYTAYKWHILKIRMFWYLQEECCATVYLFIYSLKSDHTELMLCQIIQRCLSSPILVLELSELKNNWLHAVHFQYIILNCHEKERERKRFDVVN